MRARLLSACLAAAAVVGIAAAPAGAGPAAAAARADRLPLAVPNAGDVTLARVLVVARPRHRGKPWSLAIRPGKETAPAGTQVAYAGTIEQFPNGRSLADLVVAIARPAASHGPGATTLRLRLGGRNVRARRVRQVGESNARFFFGDRRCTALSIPLQQSTGAGTVTRGAWGWMAPRELVLAALAYGCPTAGHGGDESFEGPMAGALGTGYATWGTAPDGLGVVCLYVHDAPGVGGTMTFEGTVAGRVDVPLAVPASGVAVARVQTRGGVVVTLARRGSDGRTRAWKAPVLPLPLLGLPAPPVPPTLAAQAGGCP